MTKEELLAEIQRIDKELDWDLESKHARLDDLLLAFIGDDRVTEAFNSADKWYA